MLGRSSRKDPAEPHLAAREAGVCTRERIVDERELAADIRDQTADAREQAADIRDQASDARERAADIRDQAADARERAADIRDQAADARERAAELRDRAYDERKRAVDDRENTAGLSALGRGRLENELREANEHLVVASLQAHTRAERDFLTGLPNRALLTDRLAQSIALAERHDKRVALMYVDLDNFKRINDSLGHAVGDQLLQSTAHRLQSCVRHSDTVSRQGGDEFVVLLSEVATVHDAALAAEKLIKLMAQPQMIGGHCVNSTLSIGISVYPDDGVDAATLLARADAAMYQAKRGGRNSYRRFAPDMAHRPTDQQGSPFSSLETPPAL